MGILQARSSVTEEQVFQNVASNGDYAFNPRTSDDLYADYVFGKMMKVGFKAKGKTVEISDNPPSIDYQAWCRIYPTTLALLEAAEKAAGVSPAT